MMGFLIYLQISVKVLHENIRISDLVTLQKFLLDDAQTTRNSSG
jgi:hypothetical protein